MKPTFNLSTDFARQLDENDILSDFRQQFYFADENTIYLDGNSLGRLPLKTRDLITDVVEKQWGKDLIESWNKNWYTKSEELGNKIAKIIGASKGEVIVSDSTSVNLYKLAKAALKFQEGRTQIVSDIFNFPTDLYILQGIIQEFGTDYELILARSKDEISIDLDDLKDKITERTALVVLSLVAFKSAFLYDAKEITNWAHQKGALVIWDLSHAAGAVPVEMNKTNADLAVGCTYKYLNGGPGSPAFLYVRKDLQEKLSSPIQGWFGEENPFEFGISYRPAPCIKKFLTSTPSVINLMAIEPGLDLLMAAGISNLYEKSVPQTEFFIHLTMEILAKHGFEIGSPLDPLKRGSHVSLKHPEAYRICQSLIQPKNGNIKIIPDFREPNNIRFGFTPLYTTFTEIWQTVERIQIILQTKEYEQFSNERKSVT
ncbi:MAG TPA: kynureninase [Draconibacterium sp.]|nr:kynureninase [Draconibacterium sp.]